MNISLTGRRPAIRETEPAGSSTSQERMKLLNMKICMAKDIGIHGNMFGGILMAWIDEAAAAFATEYCSTPNMVTLRVGELLFKKPLKAGSHVRIYGAVEKMGKTSITLRIEVTRYNLYSGEETSVCSTSMVMVRIDDEGRPTAIGDSVQQRHQRLFGKAAERAAWSGGDNGIARQARARELVV